MVFRIFHFFVVTATLLAFSCKEKKESYNSTLDKSNGGIDGVMDSANLLTFSEEKELLKIIQRIEDSTSYQIAIVLINSLGGRDIIDYSINIAKKIRLGGVEQSEGILISVAYQDHLARIEIGEGLERIVTNDRAIIIMDNIMIPEFKQDSTYQGLYKSLIHLESILK